MTKTLVLGTGITFGDTALASETSIVIFHSSGVHPPVRRTRAELSGFWIYYSAAPYLGTTKINCRTLSLALTSSVAEVTRPPPCPTTVVKHGIGETYVCIQPARTAAASSILFRGMVSSHRAARGNHLGHQGSLLGRVQRSAGANDNIVRQTPRLTMHSS